MPQHFNVDRLEALRLAHGLTREAFAKKIGVSRQVIHAWMTGKKRPNVASIERAAKAFGLDSAYFFADAGHQNGGRAA